MAYIVPPIMADRFNICRGCVAGSPGGGAGIDDIGDTSSLCGAGLASRRRNGADSSTSRVTPRLPPLGTLIVDRVVVVVLLAAAGWCTSVSFVGGGEALGTP